MDGLKYYIHVDSVFDGFLALVTQIYYSLAEFFLSK